MLSGAGRVAMVSGAARGIGRAVVERLLEDGWSVAAGVRSDLRGLVAGDRLLLCRYDAEDPDSPARFAAEAETRFGAVHALVNAAGVNTVYRLSDTDEAALDRLFLINVKAPMRLVRAALPALRRCGSGRVVNVASLSGKRVANENLGYAISKFALMALTGAVRREGWDDGVRATAVCPGFVATDMTGAVTSFPRAQMSDPSDVAALVATVLSLSNTATVGEVLVNCRLEPML